MKESINQSPEIRNHTTERRKQSRYVTPLPAKLEILTASGKHILKLFTRNVCSGGALCDTDEIFPIGAEVKVSLLVESEAVRKSLGVRTLVKVKGRVARCGPEGMAIRFGKDYMIQKIIDPDWQLQ